MTALLIEGAETIGALIALCLLPLVTPPTRRVTFAIAVFFKRHGPKWLIPVLAACFFIVGPLDEVIAIAIAAYPVLRNSHNRRLFRRYVSYAWKAGK